MSANLLAHETSPYLLQHKENPVHWQPWGPEALERAKREDKPILLSVGYSACHWCHVMAHESFENAEIAAVMNERFINIKVDREERPDLDSIYQQALALLGQQGGWPLTMFLTPDAHPFWGGTYFPPTRRYSRPGFTDVLISISGTYKTQREKVETSVTALRDAINDLGVTKTTETLDPQMLDRLAVEALRLVDPLNGGTHGAPKFPQPSFFLFLWNAYVRTGAPAFSAAVTVTLDRMSHGGIYDHVGGGFARYSTDEAWLVPHFEKMLYDNALLIDLLTAAWQQTRNPLYAIRVRETIAWVLRDMTVGDGKGIAFASAFDADSEGEEGLYYVWTEADVDRLLGAKSAAFKDAYDVTAHGNWEGNVIVNRSQRPELGDAAAEAGLEASRAVLLAERVKRVPPLRDDKALADWNGLMIAALANAGSVFTEPAWIKAARDAFDFVVTRMQEGGRLRHSWRVGQARHPAVLDDYANMARAAIALYEATGDTKFLDQAKAWVAVADTHYWDETGGGYFLSADDTRDVIVRTKTAMDNAQPSGNGTIAGVLARLHHLTGDAAYRDRAECLLRTFLGAEANRLIHSPALLDGFALLVRPVQIVVVGRAADPATQRLIDAAFDVAVPTRVVARLEPGQNLLASHPAFGKGVVDGKPAAYVCVGTTCSLPLTDPAKLRDGLAAKAWERTR
ncbi:MAG: thioredoxin domain-containing protein [Rhodospirillales bacterium]|nr:thioredoxin domain-containing protein [Rhodospirillales bacterium]